MSELESLIESKIYQQDDLETRITELESELKHARGGSTTAPLKTPNRSSITTRNPSYSTMDTSPSIRGSRSSTSGSVHTAEEYPSPPHNQQPGGRCELCEGPHELDACPVFAGNLDALPERTSKGGSGLKCADCDVST